MKRFYKTATVEPAAPGWTVALDGKRIRTPAKAAFLAPRRAIAEAAAAEWDGQGEEIRPAEMPVTRALNTSIDRTAPEYDQVVETVAAYGGSDLLCYRAEAPVELARRQAAAWDPLLAWAERALGARLVVTAGVMHVRQPEDGQRALAAHVAGFDAPGLTALYDLTALSGSLVIGLAVAAGRVEPAESWALSRIDEVWQEEQWGIDDEAAATAARKAGAFADAARFIALTREA